MVTLIYCKGRNSYLRTFRYYSSSDKHDYLERRVFVLYYLSINVCIYTFTNNLIHIVDVDTLSHSKQFKEHYQRHKIYSYTEIVIFILCLNWFLYLSLLTNKYPISISMLKTMFQYKSTYKHVTNISSDKVWYPLSYFCVVSLSLFLF